MPDPTASARPLPSRRPSDGAARWPSSGRRSRAWCCWRAAAPATPRPRRAAGCRRTSTRRRSSVDQPAPVPFSGTVGGASVAGTAWLVQEQGGDLVAFDPRCPHAQCAYEPTDDARFSCLCHEAFFDLDGNVLSGPPPRPLDRFASAWRRRELQSRRLLDAAPGGLTRWRRARRGELAHVATKTRAPDARRAARRLARCGDGGVSTLEMAPSLAGPALEGATSRSTEHSPDHDQAARQRSVAETARSRTANPRALLFGLGRGGCQRRGRSPRPQPRARPAPLRPGAFAHHQPPDTCPDRGRAHPPVSIFYPPADRNAHARSRPLRPVGSASRRAPRVTRPNRP